MLGKITDAAPSTRWRDAINALHAGKSVITKAGVDEYLGESLDAPGLNPKKLYKIYRSPEVIKAALPLMRGLRILDGHHFETADNLRNDKLVGTTGDEPEMKNGAALINVTIWDDRAIKEIEAKTKEQFSLGYAYKLDMTPGTAPDGRHYDGVFTEIIPEHVALVPVGRVNHAGNAGPLARIADSGEGMEFHEAMTVLSQMCPDTPADIVRAGITETLAKLNAEEAKNGPENTSKGGDEKRLKGLVADEEKGLGLAKIVTDALNKFFTKKEPIVADEKDKNRLEREDRMTRDMLYQMRDKPKEDVIKCLDTMGMTDAAKRMLKDGAKGDDDRSKAHKALHDGLFSDKKAEDAITYGDHMPAWSSGLGRGGWNHIALPGGGSGGGEAHDAADKKASDEDKNKEAENKYDHKEDEMKKYRLEAKKLLESGLHEDAVKIHLMKSHGVSDDYAHELVERARHIPASESPKGKTKDEEDAERKEAIRREVEEQRKKEREEEDKRRQKADEARDEVEKETGRLHGCRVGDSAEDIYRAGLNSIGFVGADTVPTDALAGTFRAFANQRSRSTAHLGDSLEASSDVTKMASDLLG